MKVICESLSNLITKTREETSTWLTIGKTYLVLSVYAFVGRDLMLRLIGDNPDMPILVNARQFETTCIQMPSNWRAIIDDKGNFQLTPEPWSKPGFWESYFNGERAAEQLFIQELRKIETEESYPLLA
jgi:hypothetical protein